MSLPLASTATASARDGRGRSAGRRLIDFFLLPPEPVAPAVAGAAWLPPVTVDDTKRHEDPRPAPESRLVRSVVVIGDHRDVPAVAAALANGLDSSGAPVVGCWSAPADPAPAGDEPDPPAPPALPASRRLAATLTAAGSPAVGRGRVAWSTLPPTPEDATAAWRLLRDRAGRDRATVLALAGARPEALDAVLREHDLVVVVVAEENAPLATLARAILAPTGVPAVATAPLTGASRLMALAGLGRLTMPDPAPLAAVEVQDA